MPYSARKVWFGSIATARRAGIAVASNATEKSRAGTQQKVRGSIALTPNNKLRVTRAITIPTAIPKPIPTSETAIPCRSIMRSTFEPRAPMPCGYHFFGSPRNGKAGNPVDSNGCDQETDCATQAKQS